MASEQDLVGVWQLIAHYYLEEDGSISEGPLGDDAAGLLIYHQDGYMAASLMRTRPADSDEAYLGSTDDFLSYSGRWQVRGDTVVHRVSIGSHARVVDTEQVREIVLRDGGLRLQRRLGGPHAHVVMDWQRA
ncbi:lipocalin-like protein [Kitasatospora sp. SolWspMP-SS2h]|uniref:lipocalin-like domain-containing protein n=1 Tax=Kitasatospora sp. SolWspMP-SS2h TaxID=1305729 RepID=UPI000DBA8FD8|nr:lipocalin-like domain-containing protein [Kitasatospora sp. SolWspMP-SS2h]RAJ32107.1 lipocalin-like protein [Kitasatospora sp. SolWspMP-SS2h]